MDAMLRAARERFARVDVDAPSRWKRRYLTRTVRRAERRVLRLLARGDDGVQR